MTSTAFAIRRLGAAPDAVAPDGSQVHVLAQGTRGGLAVFTLPPGAVAKAVAHRSVEEVWYFTAGRGRMWRKLGDEEDVAEVAAGVSLVIPVGTRFQFRCDGAEPLVAVGATMPPWPGEHEACFGEGTWPATL
jgi:mannose-6-phosphate isomerase-like protein (cupin superfamily)